MKVLGVRHVLLVSGSKYERVVTIASRQRGRVTRSQLLAAAVSRSQIERMLKSNFLVREHDGVYVVGHQAAVEYGREVSALLACGEGAALSHRTAASVWSIHLGDPRAPIEVLVRGNQRTRPGIVVHRTRRLEPVDLRVRHSFLITSPARTLIEVTDEFTDRELERALDEALVQNIVRLNQIADALDRLPGRRHAARLRMLIDDRRHSTLTRSELEEIFLELIRQAGLPLPTINYRINGFEIDFYWPEHRVAFELDGYRFHSTKSAFERDHRKDAALKQAGIDTNRLTWRQVTQERFATVVLVAQRLAAAERRAA